VQIRADGGRPLLVGVFVNSPLEEMRSILEIAQIDLAQLHGDEPMRVAEQLNGRGFKALRPTSETEPRSRRSGSRRMGRLRRGC